MEAYQRVYRSLNVLLAIAAFNGLVSFTFLGLAIVSVFVS